MDTGRLKTIVILILLCVNLAFGGILLSEICYALAALPALRAWYAALADRLVRLVFSRKAEAE